MSSNQQYYVWKHGFTNRRWTACERVKLVEPGKADGSVGCKKGRTFFNTHLIASITIALKW